MNDDVRLALEEALEHLDAKDLLDVASRMNEGRPRRSHDRGRIVEMLLEHSPQRIVEAIPRDRLRNVLDMLGQPSRGRLPTLQERFRGWLAAQVVLYPVLAERLRELCDDADLARSGNKSVLLSRLSARASAVELMGSLQEADLRMVCFGHGLSDEGSRQTMEQRLRVYWRSLYEGSGDDIAGGVMARETEDEELGAVDGQSEPEPNPDYFAWPSTAVMGESKALGQRHFDYQDGVMSFLGYRVGKTWNLDPPERREILDYAYHGRLPQVQDSKYMKEWGTPISASRLKKMANFIASNARDGKRNEAATGNDYSVAVAEWEDDLAYLKLEYYDGTYDNEFTWPDTET